MAKQEGRAAARGDFRNMQSMRSGGNGQKRIQERIQENGAGVMLRTLPEVR